MPKKLDDVVRLYIDNFLTGAVKTIKKLHSGGEESLTIPFSNVPNSPRSV